MRAAENSARQQPDGRVAEQVKRLDFLAATPVRTSNAYALVIAARDPMALEQISVIHVQSSDDTFRTVEMAFGDGAHTFPLLVQTGTANAYANPGEQMHRRRRAQETSHDTPLPDTRGYNDGFFSVRPFSSLSVWLRRPESRRPVRGPIRCVRHWLTRVRLRSEPRPELPSLCPARSRRAD